MIIEPNLAITMNPSKRHSEFISCSPSLSCRDESSGREEILYSIPLDPINPKSPLKQIQNLMRILFRVVRTCGGNQKEGKNITEWKAIKRADHFLIFDDLFIRWLSDVSFDQISGFFKIFEIFWFCNFLASPDIFIFSSLSMNLEEAPGRDWPSSSIFTISYWFTTSLRRKERNQNVPLREFDTTSPDVTWM